MRLLRQSAFASFLAMTALAILFSFPSAAHADRMMFGHQTRVEDIDQRLKELGDRGSREKAILYSDKGTLLYKLGRMQDAAGAFELALTYNTTRALRRHIYLYMGKAYESHGRLDRAIEAYEEALHYDPSNWRRHRDLAGLYEQTKLYQKARDLYASALKLNSREQSLWYVSGRVRRKMGLYVEAEPFLKKAEELGHDEHVVHREKSMVLEGEGKFRPAMDAWVAGAGESNDREDIARTIYLAVMAGDQPRAKEQVKRLKAAGASTESIRLYENLIELAPSGPDSLLSFRGKYPEIEALVSSFLARDKTP